MTNDMMMCNLRGLVLLGIFGIANVPPLVILQNTDMVLHKTDIKLASMTTMLFIIELCLFYH